MRSRISIVDLLFSTAGSNFEKTVRNIFEYRYIFLAKVYTLGKIRKQKKTEISVLDIQTGGESQIITVQNDVLFSGIHLNGSIYLVGNHGIYHYRPVMKKPEKLFKEPFVQIFVVGDRIFALSDEMEEDGALYMTEIDKETKEVKEIWIKNAPGDPLWVIPGNDESYLLFSDPERLYLGVTRLDLKKFAFPDPAKICKIAEFSSKEDAESLLASGFLIEPRPGSRYLITTGNQRGIYATELTACNTNLIYTLPDSYGSYKVILLKQNPESFTVAFDVSEERRPNPSVHVVTFNRNFQRVREKQIFIEGNNLWDVWPLFSLRSYEYHLYLKSPHQGFS